MIPVYDLMETIGPIIKEAVPQATCFFSQNSFVIFPSLSEEDFAKIMDLLADNTVVKQKILPDRILVFQHEFDLQKRDDLKFDDIAYSMNTLENELNSKDSAAYFKNLDVDTQDKTDTAPARIQYFIIRESAT